MRVPGDLVLRGQPGAEQQRVIGAEGDRDARLEQDPQRDLRRGRRDAELAGLARMSVLSSAAPEPVRSRLLAGIDAWLAAELPARNTRTTG